MAAERTILLVEDDEDIAMILQEMLEDEGYRVLAASSADAALTICNSRREPIDLLVTDVVMPLMTGPQLADLLATRYPDLGVLFLSGYGDTAVSKTSATRVRCLPKPIGGATLLSAVEAMLG